MIRLVLQVKNGVGLTFPFRLGQGANCLPHGSRSLTGLNYELEAQLQIRGSDFNLGIRILIGDPIPNRDPSSIRDSDSKSRVRRQSGF